MDEPNLNAQQIVGESYFNTWTSVRVNDDFEVDLPVAVGHSTLVNYNSNKLINLLAGDYDASGTALSLTGVSQPKHGTVTFNGNREVTYTPFNGYLGPDAFTYTIKDSLGIIISGMRARC